MSGPAERAFWFDRWVDHKAELWYREAEFRRKRASYRMLRALGVPTPIQLFSGKLVTALEELQLQIARRLIDPLRSFGVTAAKAARAFAAFAAALESGRRKGAAG